MNEAKRAGDTYREGAAYSGLGNAYYYLGDYRKAIEFHQQSLSIAKEIGNKGAEGAAYSDLGIAYDCLRDYKKAIEFHQQSLSIAKEIGEKGSEGTAYTLALRITLSVIIKKQSNFISSLLVSQKKLKTKV